MMPTDKERQRVATALRAEVGGGRSWPGMERLGAILGVDGGPGFEGRFLNRLADLIDPGHGIQCHSEPAEPSLGADCHWTCGGTDPLPGVPRVRVIDEYGREVFEGYYIFHENRQLAALGPDWLRPEDVDHCVAVDDFADWNMPRSLTIKKITPPHRIELKQ